MHVRGTRLTGETGTITVSDTSSVQPTWSEVDDFLYQLQNLDLVKAGNSRFDLVITDYAENGHEATRFTPGQIAALQHSPGGAKRVLAYMSIGEAETYRWYWQKQWDANSDGVPDKGAPSWLGRSNPDWLDNYKVRFWQPGWQRLIYGTPDSYLDKIIADGYDGVYLDIIDAYEYWGPGGEGRPVRKQAAQDMVDFVRALADYARVVKGKPDFADLPAERRRPRQAPRVHGRGHRHRPGGHLVRRRRRAALDRGEHARARALHGRREAGALHRLLPAPPAHRPLLPPGPGPRLRAVRDGA